MAVLAMGMTLTACSVDDNPAVEDIPGEPAVGGGQNVIDLSTITDDILLNNGDVITGKLAGAYKISIADGATVTLDGVNINGDGACNRNTPWAGITCLGSATIVLSGENLVKQFLSGYPAIQAAHNATGEGDEYTLTITGEGSLTADGSEHSGVGIGGGHKIACGNICISGGTVTALGGFYAAAIGGGVDTTCGNISITGGTVTATASYDGAAGIGSGYVHDGSGSCGDIIISGSAIVTATGGGNSAGIGSGRSYYESTNACGNISISGACTVIATGGRHGAGIGCGEFGSCGNITITGGDVTATGGDCAAGIGWGKNEVTNNSSCGVIRIEKGDDFTRVIAIKGLGATHPIGVSGYEYYCNIGEIYIGYSVIYDLLGYHSVENEDLGSLYVTISTTILGDEEGSKYKDNTWTITPREYWY